ncbi:MAG: formate dehydrogenase accessory protein FdhE [bacterium]
MKNSSEPQWWREDLKRLRSVEYIPETYINFFESIFSAHYRAKDHLVKETVYPSLGRKDVREMLAERVPFIHFDRMSIGPLREHLREHFREICSIIGKCEDPGRIENFAGSENCRDLEDLIRKTLSYDPDCLREISQKTGIDGSTLEFVALALARPLFELAAEDMKAMLAEYPWWQNYCPACGGTPFIARIRREDGMRMLRCSLCAVEWKFARVKCPFCNNEEQRSLRFFYYHEASPYRLYICDRCKRYIKCVDERKIDQTRTVDLAIEDMITLCFDALGRQKGYLSPSSLSEVVTPGIKARQKNKE